MVRLSEGIETISLWLGLLSVGSLDGVLVAWLHGIGGRLLSLGE